MTYTKRTLGALFLIFFATVGFSQKNWTEEADMTYQAGAYFTAIDTYKKAYSKEKKQSEKARVLFRIGECYRQLQDDPQAEAWYIKAEAAEYDKPELQVSLGDVLKKQGKYDQAMERYRKASAVASGNTKRDADNGIASCELALKLSKQPARYVVRNEVALNSPYYDFSPYFADKKSQSILFTSTRPGGAGGVNDPITGEGFSDIFRSERDNKGKWSAPVPLTEVINSPANEGSPWMNDKFDELYFTRCGYEKKKPFGCEVYTTKMQGKDWGEAQLIDFGIDDTTGAGHAVVLDKDIILFSSDMYGGQGGKDLWIIKFNSTDKVWGPARNLGPTINTPGDEMFPYVHENGDLFFASNGHIGMGALDLYKAPMKGDSPKEAQWGKPENMGAPINSASNDFAIIFEPGAGTDRGYFTSDRVVAGAKGKDDIYSFMMPALIFALEGSVSDIETKEPLGNVKVKLLGTDGAVAEVITDPTGHYAFEKKGNDERHILENTSYTIEVNGSDQEASNKHRYLGAKGQETTVGLKESTKFIKDFQLQCATCLDEIPMPEVFYPLGKWDLVVDDKVNSKDSLDFLFQTLIDNPTIIIELSAHTDTRGSDKSNEILSQKRAQTCVDYLVSKGIDPVRMVPVGYGESRPKITDAQIAAMASEQEREAGHAKNRRTVFSVLSFDYVPKEQPADGTK